MSPATQDTSSADRAFVLSHFPTSELLEMACFADPEGILEKSGTFLNRRLAQAVVQDEKSEKESEALGFLETLP